jgi:hypothetical protein
MDKSSPRAARILRLYYPISKVSKQRRKLIPGKILGLLQEFIKEFISFRHLTSEFFDVTKYSYKLFESQPPQLVIVLV